MYTEKVILQSLLYISFSQQCPVSSTDLVPSAKTKYQVKRGLLLDVVVRQGAAVLELLSSENQTLLVWWNTFLILNLGLNIVNRVTWLDVQSDGLSSQGFNENLIKVEVTVSGKAKTAK